MHEHDATAVGEAGLILVLPFLFAAVFYAGGVAASRRRGRSWPGYRTLAWMAGVTAALAAFVGPLADAAHADFRAHMATHLLAGMLAPLLLVMAAPVTLALRAMDVVPARRLSRVLRSTPAVVTHPVSAALLSVGTLWLVYRTPLFEVMTGDPFAHLALLVHFLLAGYLFTASIVGADPSPHRASFRMRAVVLIAAVAAHSTLAKMLYAQPPPRVPGGEARDGAMLMYYGGDAIELCLIVLLCAQCYRATRPRLTSEIGAKASA